MYIYSKKSRRRMHAIPAAIALTLVALLWLFSGSPRAEEVLSASNLAQWENDCSGCEVGSQYDILQGDVVHLSSPGDLQLTRDIEQQPQQPLLTWRWSVDTFVDGGTLLRITLRLAETDNWPARTLHYVWDTSQPAGTITTLSDFEHSIVVTGQEGSAENWYDIQRTLDADWSAIYNEPLPAIERIEVGLGMPDGNAVTGAFLSGISLISASSEQPQQPAIAISE